MHIVYATDLSLEALAGANFAFELAEAYEAAGESVDVDMLHVIESKTVLGKSLLNEPLDTARVEKSIDNWLQEHFTPRRDFELVIREGNVAEEIDAYVTESDTDFLVLGQTGKGRFSRMVLGSTAHEIAQDPPCRTFLANREFSAFGRPRHVAVGVDFDETSERALAEGAGLARCIEAELDIVHVFDPPRTPAFPGGIIGYDITADDVEELERESEDELDEFVGDRQDILEGLQTKSVVATGSPTHQLVEYTRTQAVDVLCLGTVSRRAIDRPFLGSVASGVVRHMPCTIMLVPPVDR